MESSDIAYGFKLRKIKNSPFHQNYELNLKEEVLGNGSSSVCRKCTHRETRKEYAVKIISREIDCTREINLLRACQGHPNIVTFHEVYYDEAHTYLVLELLRGGDLLERINKKESFTESEASQIMRKLVSTVDFIHSHGVVHRDLNPKNLLFTENTDEADIKIIDFGFACLKQEQETMQTPCFTLYYLAPEVLKDTFSRSEGYDENCDLWGLGVILYTMLSGSVPFCARSKNDSASAVMARIKSGEFSSNDHTLALVSSQAKWLIKGLLTLDPKKRLQMEDLKNNEWLQEDSKTQLQPSTSLNMPKDVDIAKLAQKKQEKECFSDVHSCSSSSDESCIQIVDDSESLRSLDEADSLNLVENYLQTYDTESLSCLSDETDSLNLDDNSTVSDSSLNDPLYDHGEEPQQQRRTILVRYDYLSDSNKQATRGEKHSEDISSMQGNSPQAKGAITRSRKRRLEMMQKEAAHPVEKKCRKMVGVKKIKVQAKQHGHIIKDERIPEIITID